MKRRLFALLCTVMLVFCLFPTAAYAYAHGGKAWQSATSDGTQHEIAVGDYLTGPYVGNAPTVGDDGKLKAKFSLTVNGTPVTLRVTDIELPNNDRDGSYIYGANLTAEGTIPEGGTLAAT